MLCLIMCSRINLIHELEKEKHGHEQKFIYELTIITIHQCQVTPT